MELIELKEVILQFAADQKNISIEPLYSKIKMSPEKLKGLCSENAELAEAVSLSLCIIGARREELAIRGQIESSIFLKTMYIYNTAYSPHEKNDEQKKQAIFNIVVPPIPTTTLVPEAPVYDFDSTLETETNAGTTEE